MEFNDIYHQNQIDQGRLQKWTEHLTDKGGVVHRIVDQQFFIKFGYTSNKLWHDSNNINNYFGGLYQPAGPPVLEKFGIKMHIQNFCAHPKI